MAQTREERRQSMKAATQRIRAKRRQQGLCLDCGESAVTGRVLCKQCRLDRNADYHFGYQSRKVETAKKPPQSDQVARMMQLSSRIA